MIELLEAVKSRRVIEAIYNNKKRELEVHTVGINKNGEIVVRAYERYKEFKLFKYDKMTDIKLLDKSFFVRTSYNKHGDSGIKEILFNV